MTPNEFQIFRVSPGDIMVVCPRAKCAGFDVASGTSIRRLLALIKEHIRREHPAG